MQNNIWIIYENKDILVLAKPAGVVVHHDAQHTSGTVVDWLLEKYPEFGRPTSNWDVGRPGIVHRLDKDTSGVLVVARTQSAHEYLKKLFQACPERGQRDGGVKKTYLALVVGSVKKDSDIINAPIARSTKHFEKRVVGGKQGRSREAITHYKVIERFYGSSASMEAELPKGGYTLLEVSPKTGRTHQIRSHLAHIGHPIACDKLYGGRRYACPELVEGQPLARQFLHAASIEFISPSGAKMHFDVPLPEDLAQALKLLRSVK